MYQFEDFFIMLMWSFVVVKIKCFLVPLSPRPSPIPCESSSLGTPPSFAKAGGCGQGHPCFPAESWQFAALSSWEGQVGRGPTGNVLRFSREAKPAPSHPLAYSPAISRANICLWLNSPAMRKNPKVELGLGSWGRTEGHPEGGLWQHT